MCNRSKNTSASHLNKFYVSFDSIRKKKFDGMIITGAPVENMDFEEVKRESAFLNVNQCEIMVDI